jgi:hypothetical protein
LGSSFSSRWTGIPRSFTGRTLNSLHFKLIFQYIYISWTSS